MKKHIKKKSLPRYKRFNRKQRLESAVYWLKNYEGNEKNIIKGYCKHFNVDWECAFIELEQLNIKIDEKYKEEVRKSIENQWKIKKEKKQEKELQEYYSKMEFLDQDYYFAYIVGYTPGGAPYGITWEEYEEMEKEELNPKNKINIKLNE